MSKFSWIVFKKEIIDIFRDKKTIITSIILPIVIFPIIALAMGGGMKDSFDPSIPSPIAIVGGENELTERINSIENLEIIDTDEPEKLLEELDVHAYLVIPENFDEMIENSEIQEIEVHYDPSSQKSGLAFSKIKDVIETMKIEKTKQKLDELNIDSKILDLVPVKPVEIEKDNGGIGMMMMSMILPMLIAIYAAVGGIPAAVDLGAGEKERQTLEPLLTTNASRNALIMGKYFAVVVAGILGTIASLLGFSLASIISPEFYGQAAGLPILNVLLMGVFALLICGVFSALELLVSFYARNFKEAQTYLTPFTFIVLIPAYFTMFLDGKLIPEIYIHIPILNTISILKELLIGVINIPHILMVFGWGVVYVAIALFLVNKMIHKEKVVFRN